MLIRNILNASKISFSFEFFPPKDSESWEKLFYTISDLKVLKPSFVSVTYGAGGSRRDQTYSLVVRIQKEVRLTVVSHLTCFGSTKDEIRTILEKYVENNIHNVLALRGDPPRGQKWARAKNGFSYAADLVAFIKKYFPHMCIGVAGYPEGHPETPNRLKEIEYLKATVDAGADYIITQLFFDNRVFYDFCERCEIMGIRVPILAGIMPITTREGMIRMAEVAAGSLIPARLMKPIVLAESDACVEKVGIDWATKQIRDLIDHNVQGIHLYTLNRSKTLQKIFEILGVSSFE